MGKQYGVYFIEAGKYLKIGHTQDIERRLKGLQTASPEKLILARWVPCKHKKGALALERLLKMGLAPACVRGEWYLKDDVGCYETRLDECRIAYREGRTPKPRRAENVKICKWEGCWNPVKGGPRARYCSDRCRSKAKMNGTYRKDMAPIDPRTREGLPASLLPS